MCLWGIYRVFSMNGECYYSNTLNKNSNTPNKNSNTLNKNSNDLTVKYKSFEYKFNLKNKPLNNIPLFYKLQSTIPYLTNYGPLLFNELRPSKQTFHDESSGSCSSHIQMKPRIVGH